MADPFIGEIRMFAGSWCIRRWAFCAGQLLSCDQHDALFSLLSTMYGGNGRTNFGLPDLRGRTPVHRGVSKMFKTSYYQGMKAGLERVPLSADHVPAHNHTLHGAEVNATTNEPSGKALAQAAIYSAPSQTLNMNAGSMGATGEPHINWQPSLAINYIISLFGIYPPRS